MKLKYITCFGANEHTNIDDLLTLMKEYVFILCFNICFHRFFSFENILM